MKLLLAEDEKFLSDALDSNGGLYIRGGTVNITAQFPFDYDLEGEITGASGALTSSDASDIVDENFISQTDEKEE